MARKLRSATSDADGPASGTISDRRLCAPTAHLERLIEKCDLTALQADLFALSVLPELHEDFCAAIAQTQPEVNSLRPSFALAARLLDDNDQLRARLRKTLRQGPLHATGLLAPVHPELPFFLRQLTVGPVAAAAIDGRLPERLSEDGFARRRPVGRLRRELDLMEHFAAEHTALIERRLEHSSYPAVWRVDPHAPLSASRIAALVADRSGRTVIEVTGQVGYDEMRQACLAAVSHRAVLHLRPDHLASIRMVDRRCWPEAPVIVEAADDIEIRVSDEVAVSRLRARPLRSDRLTDLWEELLAERNLEADVALLANRSCHRLTDIVDACDLAEQRCADYDSDHEAVCSALSEIVGLPTTQLATSIRPEVDWQELVLTETADEHLERLVARMRHRVTVRHRWEAGLDSDRNGGVVALFYGDPGTGKTLAAEALANRLDLPLMPVDLSRVVSKYVGETEKQLEELFASAEGFGALLFFDEADALFGKRTDISDAHDRFANIGTNYLLQRIERFEGLVILATNLRQNLDEAFRRRLHFVIPFERPERTRQAELWRRHLPRKHCAAELDVERLAHKVDMVGGEIRNVALDAACMAAACDGPITERILEEAVRRELRKSGRRIPAPLSRER